MYSLCKCIVACVVADYFPKSDYYLKDDFYHKDDYYPKGGDYNRIGYGSFGGIGSGCLGIISSGDVVDLLPPAQLLLSLLVKIRKLMPLPLPLDALLLPQRISISILLLSAYGFNLEDGPAAGGSTFAAAVAASAASRFSTYPFNFPTYFYFNLGGGSAVFAAAASAIGGSAASVAAGATHQFRSFP